MKSLEIANELYDDVKELCDYYIAGRWSDEKEIFSVKVNNAMFDLIESIQKDKQDLEVLEIIYKKRIAMEYLWFLYDYYKDFTNGINYMLEKINEHQDETRKLTMEELLKLKKWLEVNE